MERPIYDTPAMNMRAAEAVAAELPNLTGDALRRSVKRVSDLLYAANKQNEELAKEFSGQRASQIIHSAGAAKARSHGQASSPGGQGQNGSVNSGKAKQIQD